MAVENTALRKQVGNQYGYSFELSQIVPRLSKDRFLLCGFGWP